MGTPSCFAVCTETHGTLVSPEIATIVSCRSHPVEEVSVVFCGETFEEFLECRGETVVSFVPACPEGVAPDGWEGVQFEELVMMSDE